MIRTHTEKGLYDSLTEWALYLPGVVVLAVIYAAFAWFGKWVAPGAATPLWLPAGIALAALLRYGLRYWPGIVIGVLADNVGFEGRSLGLSVVIASAGTVSALLGAWLLRLTGFRPFLDRLRDVLSFIFLGAMLSSAASAIIGVAGLWLWNIIPSELIGSVWMTWWVGDVLGVLVLTPFLLVWSLPTERSYTPLELTEAVILAGLLTLLSMVIFRALFTNTLTQYEYMTFPLLIWAGLRFEQRGVTAAVIVISGIAIYGTLMGQGTFVRENVTASLFHLQTFIGIIAVTILVMTSVLSERRRAEAEIQHLNADLEEKVALRTQDLQRANDELESFIGAVSHDLRGPLQSIGGFSTALEEDFGSTLQEDAMGYIRRIQASTARMYELIEDLLNLSRTQSHNMARSSVDLTNLAESIAEELRKSDPGRSVTFSLAPVPLVNADGRLMKIVLGNLLRNAWKFTRHHPTALIEFGSLEQGGEKVYFVRDDGAGFDMKHSGKLFVIFQRLHQASEFDGTGVGLNTVYRIITRHGGKVWAEAAVEKGATFFFTIPTAAV